MNHQALSALKAKVRRQNEAAQAHQYRTLDPGEQPTMDFYLMDQDGMIHEAVDPLFLLVQATGEPVDDCEYATTLIIGDVKMRDAALNLAMWGTYSKVYDAIGLIFDPDAPDAEWENHEDPILLDAFGPYTVLQGYVKSGRYRIFEKVPYLTKKDTTLGCRGCRYHNSTTGQCAQWRNWNTHDEEGNFVNDLPACQHRVPAAQEYDDYVEVTVENMTDPSYLPEWRPFHERTKEYENARRNWFERD